MDFFGIHAGYDDDDDDLKGVPALSRYAGKRKATGVNLSGPRIRHCASQDHSTSNKSSSRTVISMRPSLTAAAGAAGTRCTRILKPKALKP